MMEKPATSSFVSVNGPSMTVRLSPLNFTRAPCEVAASPSAARRTPACASSALYCCIAANSSAVGGGAASDSFVAMTMTMKRIVLSGIRFGPVVAPVATLLTRRTRPVQIDTSWEKAVKLSGAENLASAGGLKPRGIPPPVVRPYSSVTAFPSTPAPKRPRLPLARDRNTHPNPAVGDRQESEADRQDPTPEPHAHRDGPKPG